MEELAYLANLNEKILINNSVLLRDNSSCFEKYQGQNAENHLLIKQIEQTRKENINQQLWESNEKYRKENQLFYEKINELTVEKEIKSAK